MVVRMESDNHGWERNRARGTGENEDGVNFFTKSALRGSEMGSTLTRDSLP